MKAVRYFAFLFIPLLLGIALAATEQLWTCGMHPQIIKKEPGNCPICGMKLTPIRANTAKAGGASASGERKIKYYKSTMTPGEVKPGPGKDSMGMDMVPVYDTEDSTASNIQIDAATIQRMNLRTALVEHGPVHREFRTVGTVNYNEQGLRDITTKYEGWLEKLLVNATWTVVKAGDPLFEIYSPDLYNAQLNYVVALRAEGDAGGSLSRAALARLQLFDVPADVIAEISRTKEPHRTMVFHAPSDGVVIEKMGVVGQMMKPGERIYRLADLSTVWVQAEIYEKDLPFVQSGQAALVRTSYGAERTFDGKVDLLLPQVQEQTRTATARIVLSNADGFLRPGMFVDVRFSAQLASDAVLVPDMAVLRSGERNTVFVALDGGFFEPREVKLGARSDGNNYEVLSGLRAGERVVTSGQFMLDSESQLREAIQKMLKPANAAGESAPAIMPAAPAPKSSGAIVAPDALKALTLAAADAAAPLAKDDLAGYQAQVAGLQLALHAFFAADEHAAHGPLGAFKEGLANPSDLKAARHAFAPLSSAVADLVRSAQLATATGLHVFECPMAKARWVQRDAGTKNPFYGEKMLNCGDEIDGPKPKTGALTAPPLDAKAMAGELPPGHPPIGKMTGQDALLSKMGFAPAKTDAGAAADSCGNCGMSAAAMAAGEPCEHDKK
jgi:multidrug efflux pump subunit AcrA (membrane-fusion protein)